MKKIISISIDEKILKEIDKARGIASRSKFIETILFIETTTKKEKSEKRKETI